MIESVVIGNQEWMLRNLDVDHFRNGDLIPEARTELEWNEAGAKRQPVWCHYEHNSKYAQIYGKLYNWFAVADPRILAPADWHIPSDEEWTNLENLLGSEEQVRKRLKSTEGWAMDGHGNNSSGFLGLPGGYRYGSGIFNNVGNVGYWWSATECHTFCAWRRGLYFNNSGVFRSYNYKGYGLSIRCIKD